MNGTVTQPFHLGLELMVVVFERLQLLRHQSALRRLLSRVHHCPLHFCWDQNSYVYQPAVGKMEGEY
jgi:hypothetical protein